MTIDIDKFVLAQARERLIQSYGTRLPIPRNEDDRAFISNILYSQIQEAQELAIQVVKSLDATPFTEQFLIGEIINTAGNVPAAAVDGAMRVREGHAAVLRKFADMRALAHYGADDIHTAVVQQYFTIQPNPQGGNDGEK